MENLWAFLNRYRGSESKPLGILGMWLTLMAITLPSIYFRPELFGLATELQMGVYAAGSLVALLTIYMWFWGSAAFHWRKDTSKESLPPFAKSYAEKKMKERNGIPFQYTSSTPLRLALIYKDHAFDFVCIFRYRLGAAILFFVTLNPFAVILGMRGIDVAKTYQNEFIAFQATHDDSAPDDGILERAEKQVGCDDAKAVLIFAVTLAIETIVLVVT